MRINAKFTVTASGPINIVTGLNGTQMANAAPIPRLMARSLFIQMLPGGTGLGYVMDGIYGVQANGTSPRIPSAAVATDVSADLAPATASAPGGSYSDWYSLPNGAAGIQVDKTWIDGSVPGDTIKVSYDTIE